MDGRIYFHEIKKHCTLKKLFPATKRSNLQVKTFFLATTNLDHTLLIWAAILLRFLYICQ